VVIEQEEIMVSWAKMLGSSMVHNKLDPEDGLIQRLHWLLVVNS
jgi:hypothetical protein